MKTCASCAHWSRFAIGRQGRLYATCERVGTGAGWPELDVADDKRRLGLVESGSPVVFGVNGAAYLATPNDFGCSLHEPKEGSAPAAVK